MKRKILFSFICAVLLVAVFCLCLGVVSRSEKESYSSEELSMYGVHKHYFSGLSEVEKQAYNCILKEIGNFPEKIKVPALDSEQLERVWVALMYDNPGLFMLGKECGISTSINGSWFYCDYMLDKAEYREKVQQLEEKVDKVMTDIALLDTAFEKEIYIHDLIIDTCTYIISDDLIQSTAYGVLVDGEASCEGYAKAAKLLLDACGVDNYLVCGTAMREDGSKEGHMWNIVFIDGKPYNLDVTWDDPLGDGALQNKRYSYFNITDAAIQKTHSFDGAPVGCIYEDENYFSKNQKLFDSYDADMRNSLSELIAKESKAGKIDIRFSSREVYERAIEGLFEKEDIYRVLEVASLSSDVSFSTRQIKYINDDTHYILELILVS